MRLMATLRFVTESSAEQTWPAREARAISLQPLGSHRRLQPHKLLPSRPHPTRSRRRLTVRPASNELHVDVYAGCMGGGRRLSRPTPTFKLVYRGSTSKISPLIDVATREGALARAAIGLVTRSESLPESEKSLAVKLPEREAAGVHRLQCEYNVGALSARLLPRRRGSGSGHFERQGWKGRGSFVSQRTFRRFYCLQTSERRTLP